MNRRDDAFPELRGRTFELRVTEVLPGSFRGLPLDGARPEEIEADGAEWLVEGEIACVAEEVAGTGLFDLVGSRIDASFLPGHRQTLEELGDGEYEFSPPPREDGEDLVDALELRNAGDSEGARDGLLELVGRNPRMIDVWHHLGIIEDELGEAERAEKYYRIGWEVGRDALPAGFQGRLPWGFLDNRPLLRVGHGFGLARMNSGLLLAAADIFEELLRLNPDDNAGIRFLLAPLYLREEVPHRARALFAAMPPDGMNHYTAAILELGAGRRRDALKHLLAGISRNPFGPLYFADLLPPEEETETGSPAGFVVAGSPEEARDGLRDMREAWDDAGGPAFFRLLIDGSEFASRYARLLRIEDELPEEPVGARRSALVQEKFRLFDDEGVEAVLRDLTGRL